MPSAKHLVTAVILGLVVACDSQENVQPAKPAPTQSDAARAAARILDETTSAYLAARQNRDIDAMQAALKDRTDVDLSGFAAWEKAQIEAVTRELLKPVLMRRAGESTQFGNMGQLINVPYDDYSEARRLEPGERWSETHKTTSKEQHILYVENGGLPGVSLTVSTASGDVLCRDEHPLGFLLCTWSRKGAVEIVVENNGSQAAVVKIIRNYR